MKSRLYDSSESFIKVMKGLTHADRVEFVTRNRDDMRYLCTEALGKFQLQLHTVLEQISSSSLDASHEIATANRDCINTANELGMVIDHIPTYFRNKFVIEQEQYWREKQQQRYASSSSESDDEPSSSVEEDASPSDSAEKRAAEEELVAPTKSKKQRAGNSMTMFTAAQEDHQQAVVNAGRQLRSGKRY